MTRNRLSLYQPRPGGDGDLTRLTNPPPGGSAHVKACDPRLTRRGFSRLAPAQTDDSDLILALNDPDLFKGLRSHTYTSESWGFSSFLPHGVALHLLRPAVPPLQHSSGSTRPQVSYHRCYDRLFTLSTLVYSNVMFLFAGLRFAWLL